MDNADLPGKRHGEDREMGEQEFKVEGDELTPEELVIVGKAPPPEEEAEETTAETDETPDTPEAGEAEGEPDHKPDKDNLISQSHFLEA